MTNDEPKCRSCGKPWRDHAGCESLCAEIARLRAAMPDKLTLQIAAECANDCEEFSVQRKLLAAANAIELVMKDGGK